MRCCVRVAWCRRARLGAGLACLPRLVFALSGPQLVHWYGGGSSFTPPPDLKLSSRFFFLSCDQAKKKRERKQSLAPCSSNIIRFVVVDSTAEYSRKKAIDFASRTYGSAYLTAKNAIASQHIKTAKFFKKPSSSSIFLSGGEKQTSVVSACAKRQKKKRKRKTE